MTRYYRYTRTDEMGTTISSFADSGWCEPGQGMSADYAFKLVEQWNRTSGDNITYAVVTEDFYTPTLPFKRRLP